MLTVIVKVVCSWLWQGHNRLSSRQKRGPVSTAEQRPSPAVGKVAPRSADAGQPGRSRQASFVLLVACLAQFMVILDVAIVNVAIPKMTGSLSLSSSGQQWVIDAYTLTFGGLLLLGGRLSDDYGQRRLFLVGVSIFTASSLICGFAQDQVMIELGRAAQGVGGALMAATSLSLITVAFTDPEERTKAITAWATVAASGGAAGVILGGLLTSSVSWRWVFFINIPVGAFIVFITLTQISLPAIHAGRKLDIPGALLVTTSLGLIVYAIIGVNSRGWGSATTVALLAGGALALLVLLLVESRIAADPILPLGLFASRQRAGANALFGIAGAIIFFMYFDISLHLQRVDGDDPLKTGLSFLPVTLATMATALNGRRLLAVLGVRNQLILGSLLEAGGFLWIAQIGVHAGYWTHVGLPMIVIGLGIGLTFVPAAAAATADLAPRHAGVASGLVNTSRQVGGAIGLAGLTSVATSRLGAHPALAAIAHGDRTALYVCAALAAAGAAISLTTKPAGRRQRQPAPERARSTA